MNQPFYLFNLICLSLAIFIGLFSMPLRAEVVPVGEHPSTITATATTASGHLEGAALEKQHAKHEYSMVIHHKSVATEYKKDGQYELQKLHEAMAIHHQALAKEHQFAASVHENMAKASSK